MGGMGIHRIVIRGRWRGRRVWKGWRALLLRGVEGRCFVLAFFFWFFPSQHDLGQGRRRGEWIEIDTPGFCIAFSLLLPFAFAFLGCIASRGKAACCLLLLCVGP